MLIEIDLQDSTPIYEQLRDRIIMGIASGGLTAGETLPSVRRLAADLGVNFHTVNKAYAALCGEGYITLDRRRGAVVTKSANNYNYKEKLTSQLSLAAAEAVCHGVTKEMFIKYCADAYRDATAL